MVSGKVPNIRRTLSLASHFFLVSEVKPKKGASSIRCITVLHLLLIKQQYFFKRSSISKEKLTRKIKGGGGIG